jgi:hypothetical protein
LKYLRHCAHRDSTAVALEGVVEENRELPDDEEGGMRLSQLAPDRGVDSAEVRIAADVDPKDDKEEEDCADELDA